MRNFIYFLFLVLCCAACKQEEDKTGKSIETVSVQEEKFDEEKWKMKENNEYPYRNEMLKDLMSDQEIRQLKRDEILNLLGEPNRIDTNYLFYTVEQKRLGFWPLHTKTMVIEFAPDSTVNWIKIHE